MVWLIERCPGGVGSIEVGSGNRRGACSEEDEREEEEEEEGEEKEEEEVGEEEEECELLVKSGEQEC
jgi:hypothetical protein